MIRLTLALSMQLRIAESSLRDFIPHYAYVVHVQDISLRCPMLDA